MAAYGTLVAWAKAMGHTEAADLLQQILEEEKAADEKLSQLAEGGINQEAATRGASEGRRRGKTADAEGDRRWPPCDGGRSRQRSAVVRWRSEEGRPALTASAARAGRAAFEERGSPSGRRRTSCYD